MQISGSHYRNKLKWHDMARKHHNTNPTRGGPFHYKSPSQIFYRTVRGMIPHKTERGAAALGRLKVFEGIPPPYDKMKRMVVPQALTVSKLKPGREVAHLGLLAHEIGWKHYDLLKRLEAARKTESSAYHAKAKAARARVAKAKTAAAAKA